VTGFILQGLQHQDFTVMHYADVKQNYLICWNWTGFATQSNA